VRPGPGPDPVAYAPLASADRQFWSELHRLMDEGAKRFCDVGGGDRPAVQLSRIDELGLDYVVLDISQAELAKAPSGYRLFEGSVLDRERVSELLEGGRFDVVVSRWTAEHMPDGRLFHETVRDMLRPGGTAVHIFPTLYAPPFVFNRMLDSGFSARLLARAQPSRRSKFPAYYSWCRGPSKRQLRRLTDLGYSVERYVGFFGHNYYRRLKPLDAIHRRFVRWQLGHPHPLMTSFALVVLKRSD
jgi:SAM-dependent methyltransferase